MRIPPEMILLETALVMGTLLLLGAHYLRYKHKEMKHRERMLALEKGIAAPEENGAATAPVPATPRGYLLRGLIWLFVGLGLTLFLVRLSQTSGRPVGIEEALTQKLWRTRQLKDLGATEEQLRQFEAEFKVRGGKDIPIGVAFVGLIPTGVGLAYLIFYALEGRKRE